MDSEDNPVEESISLGHEDLMNDLQQALDEAEVRLKKAEARNNHLLETLIATSQLQQALGFEDAKKVLQEIMVNFVGATDFAIAMVSEEGDKLLPVMAVGLSEEAVAEIDLASGVVANCVQSDKPFTSDSLIVMEKLNPAEPRVVVPLKLANKRAALLLCYRFLGHKTEVRAAELQLYQMLSTTILVSLLAARLVTSSGRDFSNRSDLLAVMLPGEAE
jgi:hypothetical protein